MRIAWNPKRPQKKLLVATFAVLYACVSRNATSPKDRPDAGKASADDKAKAESIEKSVPGACPDDSVFVAKPRTCVSRGGVVLGPFPLELQELCRELFPSEAGTCVQRQDWPVEFFDKLKEKYADGCPPGTKPMAGGSCLSSGVVYGPFTNEQVDACRAKFSHTDQSQCLQLSWPLDVFERVDVELSDRRKFAAAEIKAEEKKNNSRAESRSEKSKDSVDKKEQQSDVRKIIVIDDPETASAAGGNAKSNKDDSVAARQMKAAPAPTPAATVVAAPTATPDPRKTVIKIPEPTPTPARELPESKKMRGELEEPVIKPPTYCIFSWDERPGTADFSTRNERLASLSKPLTYPLDRPDSAALVRVPEFQAMDMCMRAQFLKKCFQRVILESDTPAAQSFRAWSLGRVRPVEAHMAFVMKESRLGLWSDQCWKGQCKGVGIAKVTKARTAAGRWIAPEDPLWQGIAHNILTNLEFSLRLLAESTVAGPTDLYSLAYLYKGKSGAQERYALDIDRYYKELLGCQLDER